MKNKFTFQLISILVTLIFSTTTFAGAPLSDYQKKELTVFSIKAMGLGINISDVKNVLSATGVYEVVAAGLNMNKLLCAELLDIRPLKLQSKYEASCIAYRGGSSKKSYILDALKGVAFEA